MKKSEVKIGSHYQAKVSGSLTVIRIDSECSYGGWSATNVITNRVVRIKSAMKLRSETVWPLVKKVRDVPTLKPKPNTTQFGSPQTGFPEDGGTVGGPSFLPEIVVQGGQHSPSITTDCLPLQLLPEERRRLEQIEGKYSTERGATEEERQEANAIVAPPGGLAAKLGNRTAPAPVSSNGLKPTEEQEAILAAVAKGHPVLVIEAGAGTGKTSTLRMIGTTLPGNGQYTAFNSSLVAESKGKFAGTAVACNTTHSLGFRAEGKRFAHRLNSGRVKSDQVAKILGIEKIVLGEGDSKKTLSPSFLASQVMGAVKRFCQSAEAEIDARHFCYLAGLDLPVEGTRTIDWHTNNNKVKEYLLPFARKAWADLSNPDGVLPFSHDCYVKIWQLNDPVISADYILLDEAQDTAPVMLDILRQQKCPVILVGDSAQQIYEWRGAVNALATFPDAPRRFLSQSFRFGPAIAAVANAVLEALEEPTQLRLKGLPSIPSVVQPVDNPTAILCRTNAVAIATLLGAIRQGKRPFLIGGGSDVTAFVGAAQELQQGKPTIHPELACFSNWTEVQEYSKLDEGEDLQLMVKIIDEFGAETILGALRGMVKEDLADLVISTAHKSKGREWDRVRVASDFPTRSKCSDADLKLLYVTVTRAKLELDVSSCPFFSGQDSMDLDAILAGIPRSTAAAIAPPTPSVPSSALPVGSFTWARSGSTWAIRGPRGYVGQTVVVARKNGSTSECYLAGVDREYADAVLYRVGQ